MKLRSLEGSACPKGHRERLQPHTNLTSTVGTHPTEVDNMTNKVKKKMLFCLFFFNLVVLNIVAL